MTDLAASFLTPGAYPWRPRDIRLVETHLSWVFLAGDRVVKIKKAVAYAFVDFRDPERRRQSCLDEVRLNLPLTEGVYLGVRPIVANGDGFRLGEDGDDAAAVEWATVMRRMDADRMLDVLLRKEGAPADLAGLLAARLLPFHDRAERVSEPNPGDTDAPGSRVTLDNLDELTPFLSDPVGPVQAGLIGDALRRFVIGNKTLLRDRFAAGWTRDGHGDLRAEHVCLEPEHGVQIFDRIEFSPALRRADVASDLAFLLMDLHRLGAAAAAAELLHRYRAAGFDLPDGLVRFYRTHRALVRAKVGCLNRRGVQNSDLARETAETLHYLDMAAASALTVRPTLLLMTGLSGSGKSTVAHRLARALDARLFASDLVRKELAGVAGPAGADWHAGIYTPEWTEATYAELFARAETALARGEPVILDATFLDSGPRETAAAVVARTGARLVLVETRCDAQTTERRLIERAARADSPSDATIAVFRQQQAALAANPPLTPPDALLIDTPTDGPVHLELEPVFAALAAADLIEARIPDGAVEIG